MTDQPKLLGPYKKQLLVKWCGLREDHDEDADAVNFVEQMRKKQMMRNKIIHIL